MDGSSPEVDPWASEARLVAQLGRLAAAQVPLVGPRICILALLNGNRDVPA